MAQSITLKIAGKEYPLMANSPEMEQVMRLAAEDINKMLAKYDEKFPTYPLVDKLAFVTLNETVSKLNAQRKMTALAEEATALKADTDAYLAELEKK